MTIFRTITLGAALAAAVLMNVSMATAQSVHIHGGRGGIGVDVRSGGGWRGDGRGWSGRGWSGDFGSSHYGHSYPGHYHHGYNQGWYGYRYRAPVYTYSVPTYVPTYVYPSYDYPTSAYAEPAYSPSMQEILIIGDDQHDIAFTLEAPSGSWERRVEAGGTYKFTDDRPWTISFHRGGDLGTARMQVGPGAFRFEAGRNGWELRKIGATPQDSAGRVPEPATRAY